MSDRTFTLIKPDAVGAGNTGKILSAIEQDGFRIRALKMKQMTLSEAGSFYSVHTGKPFYGPLVEFMCSGPVVAAILEKKNAVSSLRELVGVTDPAQAAEGTIRRIFGRSVRHNAVHASDSAENAEMEWQHFFTPEEIMGRG